MKNLIELGTLYQTRGWYRLANYSRFSLSAYFGTASVSTISGGGNKRATTEALRYVQ